jgi:molybdopterin synthase sulfur carrier subunit
MSKILKLSPFLRMFTNEEYIMEVNGATIGECIDELEAKYPGVKKEIVREDGNLHIHLEVYVNTESAYPEDLAKKVKDGDEITIITMISGG